MKGAIVISEKKKHNVVSTCKFLEPEKKKGGFFSRGKVTTDPKDLNKVDIVIKKDDKIVSIGQ